MAGGAAVWCWYDVRAGCCCPLLYSYVGRGGVVWVAALSVAGGVLPIGRAVPIGAAASCPASTPAAVRWCAVAGAISPGRAVVRIDPARRAVLLSLILCSVGGGVELSPASPRGGCNLPGAGRRPHRGGAILSRSAAISPAASGIKPPTENAPEKSPHGKRATKKEVNAARAVSTSFFASNFRAAGITRRRCCCRPRRAAGIRRAPCGRRKRP